MIHNKNIDPKFKVVVMAKISERREENISGDLFVDRSCIDCDTCRWMAPDVFGRVGSKSAVINQPETQIQKQQALQALLSCPTASIGTIDKPRGIRDVQQTFPLLIDKNVYHCGYHSEKSFGAASYLIKRSEGNILVDSPRFSRPLVKQLEKLGGVDYLYLTHKDDVADHQLFHDHFGCDRILHKEEIQPHTESVEIKLDITEPWNLADDLLIIPVPGHTEGHTILLYQNEFLFTGDHLAWSSRLHKLVGFRNFCWYSWSELVKSNQQLTKYKFEWVLPGHGRRYHAQYDKMQTELAIGMEWMKNN